MRALRWLGAGLAAAVLLLAAAGGGWVAVQLLRDPVSALDRETGEVRVVADSAYATVTAAGEPRRYRDLALATAGAGTVRITVSRPAARDTEDLPLALVLGGLRTGRQALDFVPRHGPNLLVAYEYPDAGGARRGIEGPGDVLAVRSAVLRVPAQVVAASAWLKREPAVDAGRTSLLGYSLGSLFAPAAQRLAAERGTPFGAVVLAHGGTDLARLFAANLDLEPTPLRGAVSWLAAVALRPVEPALHLPHLSGDVLVLQGTEDERIPEASLRRFAELVPEPKEVVWLEGGHMGPGREDVNERVVRRSQEWLARRGHVNPPPARVTPAAPGSAAPPAGDRGRSRSRSRPGG